MFHIRRMKTSFMVFKTSRIVSNRLYSKTNNNVKTQPSNLARDTLRASQDTNKKEPVAEGEATTGSGVE